MARPIISCFAAAMFVCSVSHIGAENCPTENCIEADKCTEVIRAQTINCPSDDGRICCSVVKAEFRTACRHHGGECMDSCAPTLSRDTVDCAKGTTCCVLV